MPLSIAVKEVRAWYRWVHTRLPFRYGQATLTRCPHLVLVAGVEDESGHRAHGVAADNLPPRWFDKTPGKSFEQELREQMRVIGWAVEAVKEHPPATAFELWWDTYHEVGRRAQEAGLPPLLAGFGPSLIERALLDAVGRLTRLPFAALVPSGALGIDLGRFSPLPGAGSLGKVPTADVVAVEPLRRVHVRHTVGIADPIEEADVTEPLDDGLPQSLAACLSTYGYRYLKIKLANRLSEDIDRLARIAALLDRTFPDAAYHVSLDGNEQYATPESVAALFDALASDRRFTRFASSVLFVEQPLARDVALDPDRCTGLAALGQRFPITIDESDDDLDAFVRAVALGYAGTSHKNCKNIFKSLANAARIRQGAATGRRLFLTAEDLTNLPPVALLEDLAVVCALQIPHVERNGHHYFRGLDHLTAAEQERLCRQHSPMFRTRGGLTHLDIRQGQIDCQSLQIAGLGVGAPPDLADWTEIDPITADGIGAARAQAAGGEPLDAPETPSA
ncbi:MAG TPA: hypothetical protein VF234_10365 [Limnochordia bacterium]